MSPGVQFETRDMLTKPRRCASLTGLLQVLDADVVHGEEGGGGAVLGTHVGDGGAVGDGQLGHAGAEELHELAHHAHLAQVLSAGTGNTERGWISTSFRWGR